MKKTLIILSLAFAMICTACSGNTETTTETVSNELQQWIDLCEQVPSCSTWLDTYEEPSREALFIYDINKQLDIYGITYEDISQVVEELNGMDELLVGKTLEEQLDVAINYKLNSLDYLFSVDNKTISIDDNVTYVISPDVTVNEFNEEISNLVRNIKKAVYYVDASYTVIELDINVDENINNHTLSYQLEIETLGSRVDMSSNRYEAVLDAIEIDISNDLDYNVVFNSFYDGMDNLNIRGNSSERFDITDGTPTDTVLSRYNEIVVYFNSYDLDFLNFSYSCKPSEPGFNYSTVAVNIDTGEIVAYTSLFDDENLPLYELVKEHHYGDANPSITIELTFVEDGIEVFIRLDDKDTYYPSKEELDTYVNSLGNALINKFETEGKNVISLRYKFIVKAYEGEDVISISSEQVWNELGEVTTDWQD